METNKSEIIIYQTDESGQHQIDVRLDGETVWLDLNQLSTLFQRDKSVISRHLNNIYKTGELDRNSTVAKNATVQKEGGRKVTRSILSYNLDAIISLGYRVNSIRGTQFRIWATKILRQHLVEGFTVNRKRLEQKGVDEARQTLALLSCTLQQHNLVSDEGKSVLEVITQYANTWRLLLEYDEDRLALPKSGTAEYHMLDIVMVRDVIMTLKQELLEKKEATELFGNERSDHLEGILGSIYQTFGGHDLYPSLEEKAAHLLYFIIKDHPFTDGNKRIGSFLFIMFLQQNRILARVSIDNKALVSLTLLTASSDPSQKELIIRLIVNLLVENRDEAE